jgi:hypothetical protein
MRIRRKRECQPDVNDLSSRVRQVEAHSAGRCQAETQRVDTGSKITDPDRFKRAVDQVGC